MIDLIEPGRKVSIEREVWPVLAERGLHGYAHRGAYWMDIGTPERYLQGTADILAGRVQTRAGQASTRASIAVGERCDIAGEVRGPALLGAGVRVGRDARHRARRVLGPGVAVGAGAVIERSVVLDGAQIGARATVRDAILAPGAQRRRGRAGRPPARCSARASGRGGRRARAGRARRGDSELPEAAAHAPPRAAPPASACGRLHGACR